MWICPPQATAASSAQPTSKSLGVRAGAIVLLQSQGFLAVRRRFLCRSTPTLAVLARAYEHHRGVDAHLVYTRGRSVTGGEPQ